MLDWRNFVSDVRFHLNDAKSKNITDVSIVKFEEFINTLESDFAIQDKFDILKEINTSKNENDDKYLDFIVENQIKSLSATYDKGASYTSLVIGAGYATFFGIWSSTKDILSIETSKISFLLLSISAISFVFFEVYKIVITSFKILKQSQATKKAAIKRTFKEQYEVILKGEKDAEKFNLGFFPIWVITTFISIIFALVGIGFLVTSLLKNIIA